MVGLIILVTFFAVVIVAYVSLAASGRMKNVKRGPMITYHKIGCRKPSSHSGKCY